MQKVPAMSFASDPNASLTGSPTRSTAYPSDYVVLLKPRVMSLVVLTALTGLVTAPGHTHPVIGAAALIAIAVGAGAAGALNMWFDADIDALMQRTRNRPIPAGKISADEALAFGSVLAVLSVLTLGIVANWLAAALLAFTIMFYGCVYTMWLKRWTPQNIVIGGIAGAMPPMIGCAAASGTVSGNSFLLFVIIFVWTPPHFWALALARTEDYARAGLPMLPNVKGPERTRREILIYSLVLAPLGCLPWLLGFAGPIYGLVAFVGGTLFIVRAWQNLRVRDRKHSHKTAMRLFGYSILYLFTLFTVLLGEHVGSGLIGRFS
jgi:protoheme IX farnesyltransferase